MYTHTLGESEVDEWLKINRFFTTNIEMKTDHVEMMEFVILQ